MAFLLPNLITLVALVAGWAHFSSGQTNTLITVTNPTTAKTCEPITTEIPTCINVGWTNTTFPNLRSHSTQAEAYQELEDFNPLIQVRCSNKIVHFLCAVYAPVCLYAEGSSEPLVLGPCRSLCDYVRSECEPQLNAVGFPWPAHFNCDNFPNGTTCVEVADSITIPHIPGLELVPATSTASPTPSAPFLENTRSSLTIASPSPIPSPTIQPPHCEGFLDEGKCVESCNSRKYTADNDQNVFLNSDYRVTLGNHCLTSCPDGYVEHMSQCVTSCPQGFLKVNGICEECIGNCDQDLAATAPRSVEIMGPFVTWSAPMKHIGNLLGYKVKVTAASGSVRSITKEATTFHHVLGREDIPADLGGGTSVRIQVQAETSYSYGEWSEEQSIPVTTLMISDLIPILTDPEPKISLIKDSPLVIGRSVTVHLTVNHPFSSLDCRLSSPTNTELGDKAQFRNCSSGMVTYDDLPDGAYNFHARAQLQAGGKLITKSRRFRPDNLVECSAHLINNGITISGNMATVEFSFIGDYTRCKLDDEDFKDCTSPYLLTNLSPGKHFLKITPQLCRAPFRYPVKFYFDIQ